jgi:FMN reductase
MADLLTITASPSASSALDEALDVARRAAERYGLSVGAIAIRDLNLCDLLCGKSDNPSIAASCRVLEMARIVVLGTPVYKAAYTGLLRIFLDALPSGALRGKVAVPILTAGAPIHFARIDAGIRATLIELGAADVTSGLFLVDRAARAAAGEGVLPNGDFASHLDAILRDQIRPTVKAAALAAVA